MAIAGGELVHDLAHEAEMHETPDLMQDFASQEVTVFGQRGKLEELLDMCPVDHDQMTIEAKNMFIVTALNESGASVEEKYIPYFKEVLDSRGMEVRVQVVENRNTVPQQTEVVKESRPTTEELVETLAVRANREENQPAPIAVTNPDQNVHTESLPLETSTNTSELATSQMDEWLTRMSAEYEAYTSAAVEDEVFAPEESHDTKKHQKMYIEGDSLQESAQATTEKYEVQEPLDVEAPAIQIISEKLKHDSIIPLEQQPVVEETPARSVTANKEEFEPVGEIEEIGHADVASIDFIPESQSINDVELDIISELGDTYEKADLVQDVGTALEEAEDLDHHIAAINELLDQLEYEESESRDIEHLAPGSSIETQSATEFTQQFFEMIQEIPENPQLTPEEQPAIVLSEVIELAIKIQELDQADLAETAEELQHLKEEIEVVVTKLFNSLGLEPSVQTIALFVEKILESDLSELKINTLSVAELAKQGTHEFKLEDWFRKFKHTVDQSISFGYLVGKLAVADLVK